MGLFLLIGWSALATAFSVYPNVEYLAVESYHYDVSGNGDGDDGYTCECSPPPGFIIDSSPAHGTLGFGTKLGSTDTVECGKITCTGSTAYYTWTDDKTTSTSDHFTLSNEYGVWDIPITLVTPEPTPTLTPTPKASPTPTATPTPTGNCNPLTCTAAGGQCVNGVCVMATPTPVPTPSVTPSPPAAPPGSTLGGPSDNPNTVENGGDGPASDEGCTGLPNYWVSTSSLNLSVQDRVCMYLGKGPQLAMTHSWNADASQSGMFGSGWRFAYEWDITKTSSGATLRKGSGQALAYTGSTATSPVALMAPSGYYDTLTWMGSYWLWVEKSTKWTYRFVPAVINGQTSSTKYTLTSITDTNGNAVMIAHTTAGTIQTVTDSAGRITTFTSDANNRITRMDAPDRRYATYQHDGNGNLIQSVDLLGTVTTYTYDSSGYMTSLTVGDKTVTFTYALFNNIKCVASVKNAGGFITTYAMSGSTVTMTDPLGNATVYTSSSEGFTSGITDPLSDAVAIQYSGGNPVKYTDALGNQTLKAYDARGNVTQITDASGHVTAFTYDSNNNLTSMTDVLGKTSTFTYDAKSNLTKVDGLVKSQKLH